MVEPSRSCKSLKLAGIFLVYTHPKWCVRLLESHTHFDWPPALTASTSIRNDFNIYLKPYPYFEFPCISLDSLQQRRAIFDCPSRWLNWRGIGRPGRPEWSPKRSFHLKSPYSVISPFRCIMLPTCATAAFFWKAAAHSRCDIPMPILVKLVW